MRDLAGLTAYRTEWMILGKDEWLAGSIDFVAQGQHGELILIDWKRSKDRVCCYAFIVLMINLNQEGLACCIVIW